MPRQQNVSHFIIGADVPTVVAALGVARLGWLARSERCTANYRHFSQRDVAKDGAETLRSSRHYPSNLYLRSQFDDPIGRNLEVISRVASVARHRGIQGLPP